MCIDLQNDTNARCRLVRLREDRSEIWLHACSEGIDVCKLAEDTEVVMACLREEHQLEHPNIVVDTDAVYTKQISTLYGIGKTTEQGACFCTCFHDILQALYWMHANGFIHRDVKPQNIIQVGDTFKLIDFGLTRKGSCSSTMTGYTISRYYRPPEMMGTYTSVYDGRVDVYSLGITIYELRYGMPPFTGDSKTIVKKYKRFTHRVCSSI